MPLPNFTLPAPTTSQPWWQPIWANFLALAGEFNSGVLNLPNTLPYVFAQPTTATFSGTIGTITSQTNKNGRLVVVVPSAATQVQGLTVAAPTPPYTIDLCFTVSGGNTPAAADEIVAGIGCTDGTKLNIVDAGVLTAQGPIWRISRWTNRTTFSADAYAPVAGPVDLGRIFVRMTNDGGTHRTFAGSSNGLDYVTLIDENPTVFLTETKVGIFFNNSTTGALASKFVFYNWVVTPSILGDAA